MSLGRPCRWAVANCVVIVRSRCHVALGTLHTLDITLTGREVKRTGVRFGRYLERIDALAHVTAGCQSANKRQPLGTWGLWRLPRPTTVEGLLLGVQRQKRQSPGA